MFDFNQIIILNFPDITIFRAYQRILAIFSGDMTTNDLSDGDNRWRMLNVVTEFVDYECGSSDGSRMNSACLDTGEAIKNCAYTMLMA